MSFVLGITSSHKLRTPTSARDKSPLINSQLPITPSETSSLQSSGEFEFDDLPTWTPLSNKSSVTSITDASDDELQINDDADSDVDGAVSRKRQRTQTGSNPRITISNAHVKSRDKKSAIVDGGSKKHKLPSLQNLATPTIPAVDSEDTCMTRVAISNTEPSPTTSISSCVQIDPSSITVVNALSQNASVKEGKEGDSTSTHSRRRVNGLSGLLVSRPLEMSKSASTSDFSNLGVLKDREEPPRKTRGLAFRTTNWSYGTKSRKSQGRIADQDELELWTNADVASIGFRKPDKLRLLEKLEEESTKRNVSHILTCLMEMEAGGPSENVAGNEGVMLDCIQAQIVTPESVGEKRTSKGPECSKMVKNFQAVDGLKGQEDEETGVDVNSPQVPLPQLEDWSTTVRSLLKGKKNFQRQVCCGPSLLSLKHFKFAFRT